MVNGVCAVVLNASDHNHGADNEPSLGGDRHPEDLNLKAAYLHVLADALTSVLAIVALLAAKYLGYVWMDPAMGIVGALLVARWSLGLLRTTSAVLLDRRGPSSLQADIAQSIEADGDSRIADLHVWSIGPDVYAAEVTVVARSPSTSSEYKARIPRDARLAHVAVEVHARTAAAPLNGRARGKR